jgi:rhodanese-related sulfurtransferase
MGAYNMISAKDMAEAEKKGVILDVRTVPEHDSCKILRPHDLIPLDRLDPKDFMLRRGLDREADVYILCKGGTRAKAAAEKFIAAGYPNMHVIEGGIMACESMGEPVDGTTGAASAPSACATETKKVIPLERQVRIAAGILIAIGAALSLLVNPLFGLVPLFVGCGLIFAGVTDRCGMAFMLGRAPWNKGASSSCMTPVRPNSIPPSSGSAGGCA